MPLVRLANMFKPFVTFISLGNEQSRRTERREADGLPDYSDPVEASLSYDFRAAARLYATRDPAGLSTDELLGWGYAAYQAGDAATARQRISEGLAAAGPDYPARAELLASLARAELELDEYEAAQEHADAAAAAAILPDTSVHAYFVSLQAGLELCADISHVRRLDEALQAFPSYPGRATALLLAAQCVHQLGDVDGARERLRMLSADRPWLAVSSLAGQLADELDPADDSTERTHADRLEHLRMLRRARHRDLAAEGLDDLNAELAALPNAAQALVDEALLQTAINHYESARFVEAANILGRLYEDQASSLSESTVERFLVLSISRIGEISGAWELARTGCLTRRSARACASTLAEYAWDFGMYEEVAQIVADYPRDHELDAYQLEMLPFLMGAYEESVERFEEIANSSSGHVEARARYWQARSLAEMGETSAATGIYTALSAEAPLDYYGLLAASRLEDDATVPDDTGFSLRWVAGTRFPGDQHGQHASLGELLQDVPTISDLAEMGGNGFPELGAAAALYRVGAAEPARRHLRAAMRKVEWAEGLSARQRSRVQSGRPTDPPRSLLYHRVDNRRERLGLFDATPATVDAWEQSRRTASTEEQAAYQASVIGHAANLREPLTRRLLLMGDCFYHLQEAGGSGTTRLPPPSGPERDAWARSVCAPFPALTARAAIDHNLPPALLWALVLTESAGNPDSVSHADAWGLLQVITTTAELIGEARGVDDFGTRELLDPSRAVDWGVWYLSQLGERFHGQEPLMLVAYNAGPHQVARWLDWRGTQLDGDAFLETVPYSESRNYAKRILRVAATFEYLLSGRVPLLNLEMNPADLETIYF